MQGLCTPGGAPTGTPGSKPKPTPLPRRSRPSKPPSAVPPPPAPLTHLRGYLPQLLATEGTGIERKAAIEALIHEIRISSEVLIPVYKIPAPGTPIPGHDSTPRQRFAQWDARLAERTVVKTTPSSSKAARSQCV